MKSHESARRAEPGRMGRYAGLALAAAFGATAWIAAATPARAATTAGCEPADGAQFICGATDVEDFAPIPGTPWVIGSDLPVASNPQGYLHLFDTDAKTVTVVTPADIYHLQDTKRFPDCPGMVDMRVFAPHGLDLAGTGNHRTLYVVNHGGRESIEVFDIDLSGRKPGFLWTGCILAPQHFWPDAVAALPDGGLIVTSLWDPTDPQRLVKLSGGQPVGGLDEWHPGAGWSVVPGSVGMSGPNGVIVSPDGLQIYVAVWSGKEVTRISRGRDPIDKATVPTGFLTDNLRWSPDGGTIYVGGQDASVQQVLECFESVNVNCKVPFEIMAMNPQTLAMRTLVKSGVYGVMGAGTGAIRVGDEYWVSTFRGDRIARFPVN